MARKREGTKKPAKAEGRFSYDGLDRVIHEKARLGILASLIANGDGLLFNDLKQLCALTDGNLSRHLAVLADAGVVEVRKSTQRGRQLTAYGLTPEGRRRFADYINVLENVVSDAQPQKQLQPRPAAPLPKWPTA